MRYKNLSHNGKGNIFDLAIKNLEKKKISENKNARYEILELLLIFGFDKDFNDGFVSDYRQNR